MQLIPRDTLPTNGPRSYDELIVGIETCFDAGWRARREDLAALVGGFARDFTAMRRLVAQGLAGDEWPSLAGGRSFWLTQTDRYFIRLNLWYPPASREDGQDRYARYQAVGDCHSHNFDFITTCVFGSGYESQFFRRIDDPATDYVIGDTMPVERSPLIRLGLGDVMIVDRDLDFHTQDWPKDFSVTLNLVPLPDQGAPTRQYLIDETTTEVLKVIDAAA